MKMFSHHGTKDTKATLLVRCADVREKGKQHDIR